ncbi:glycosyltransferase [Clostridium chromiireducens]|uniref:Glycosyltransferase n=1 Tax=Clostridium chromiireducens TaxID=225345 RepID=A0A964RM41_9CLOT|nr:glycosyltransferase family 4 protein [Clostridium chromiireducens]MVX64182.1 glycosyltransferase [Clostridium chromiireducens]
MNIVIISTGVLPQPAIKGGAVESLVDILINYNEKYRLHDLSVYTIYDENAIRLIGEYSKCKFIYIKRSKLIQYLFNKEMIPIRFMLIFYINKVVRLIKKRADFDLICIQNEYIYGNRVQKVSRGKPLILHLHNDYINVDVKGVVKKINCFDGIISISDYLKKRIKEVNQSVKVDTIYNGIDLTKFKDVETHIKSKVKEKFGINEDEVVVVYAGRLTEEKGIKELLIAFNDIPSTYNITLLIIGNSLFNGSVENQFVKELKKLANKKRNKIIFTGYISYEEMPDIYSIGDIGCVPSVWEEPFGLTVIEQMAMGLPMIVSDAGAIPEIVDNSCALIVKRDKEYTQNLKESILKLYVKPELRERMGMQAKLKVEKFSADDFSELIYKYINEFRN